MSDPHSEPETKRGDFAKKKGEIILREHEYDGIQEFDQKLPNWWLFTFYIAIAFFLVYWVVYYHTSTIENDYERITSRMTEIHEQKEAELTSALASLTDKVLIQDWAGDPARVAAGKEIYLGACTACHGQNLDAMLGDIPLSGRSLTDGGWHYGKAPTEIFKMINNGSPEGSAGYNQVLMIAKGGAMLTTEEVAEVTAFLIASNPDDFSGMAFDEKGMMID